MNVAILKLLSRSHSQDGLWGGCQLQGIRLRNGGHLGNLGSVLLSGLAIVVTTWLILRSERKRAAVGRREMQLFLLGYFVISVCAIFSIGLFPIQATIRIAFSGIHIAMITASTWMLLMNAIVGYQLIDDGTPLSLALVLASSLAIFIATGFVALGTGYNWIGTFSSSRNLPNRNIALYVLYQLAPLAFLVVFFVLETVLVLKILGETRPMLYLAAAAILFATGQVFNYIISSHICKGTGGRIDGSFFESLFTLCSVIMTWVFWSSITEDDWPTSSSNPNSYP